MWLIAIVYPNTIMSILASRLKERQIHYLCTNLTITVIMIKEGEELPWGPIYAQSESELAIPCMYLVEMSRTGKIRPSTSPAGAPILFVWQAHCLGLRLCMDY
jgi:hypothetical protein